jgi:hypothetical protein
MKNIKLDLTNPKKSYNNTKSFIIKEQQSMILKSNLTEIYELTDEDNYKIYDKTTDRIIETIGTTAVCIHILNQYEMFEHSKELYDLIKDYFIYGYTWLEQSNEEQAETEFTIMFTDIMSDLEKVQNDFK